MLCAVQAVVIAWAGGRTPPTAAMAPGWAAVVLVLVRLASTRLDAAVVGADRLLRGCAALLIGAAAYFASDAALGWSDDERWAREAFWWCLAIGLGTCAAILAVLAIRVQVAVDEPTATAVVPLSEPVAWVDRTSATGDAWRPPSPSNEFDGSDTL